MRVTAPTLKVSVAGGATGVRVGIANDAEYTVDNCEPIKGEQTDAVVSWKGKSDLSKHVDGAVTLIFSIPADATAFAFSV